MRMYLLGVGEDGEDGWGRERDVRWLGLQKVGLLLKVEEKKDSFWYFVGLSGS